MRILHVNKFFHRRGGAEAYMLDLAAMQEAKGHEIAFFAMTHPDNDPAPHEDSFPPYTELDPPPNGVLARAKVVATMLWSRKAAQGIEEVVATFRPEVAHLNNIYHQLSPSILRPLRAAGVPIVLTLHDYKLACPTYQFLDHGEICEACLGGKFRHAITRRCNRGSLVGSIVSATELKVHTVAGAYDPVDVFVCPSQFIRTKMQQAGVYSDRMVLLNHFADLANIVPATAAGAGVVFGGRLAHEKGVDVLIDAIGLIEGAELTIAGDGPDRAELEQRAAATAPGRVTFAGRLGKAELHALIRASAVLTIPSRWYENQPMIILEALGCARPVVGSDLGGIPELIRPGVDGVLVAHSDPEALAAALRPFVADPARAHEMGLAGRQRAVADFAPARHLAGLEDIYRQAATRAASL